MRISMIQLTDAGNEAPVWVNLAVVHTMRRADDSDGYTELASPNFLLRVRETPEQVMAAGQCPVIFERVLGCLLDHYLSDYDQNDGQEHAGIRDRLGKEAETLVPNWRQRRDEWTPKR